MARLHSILGMLLLPLLLLGVSAAPECLKTADHRTLNKRFTDGGPGTKVFLCPRTEYFLTGSIIFTASDQEIATLGYPTGEERAVLRIASELAVTAIQGDCRRCARVGIASLVIDGGRTHYGRSQDPAAPGLLLLGGNEGHSVRDCALRNPRGWTAVHVREGAKLQCKGAVIERNEIGPVGEEYNPAVDGPDPESSPLGRPLADGISIACRDSIVRDNKFIDCTDAGIVVYCSPGTLVASNTISTVGSSAIGGILMVDATPFEGDYSGVVVRDNILDAARKAMRVGIGIGLSILSDDIETILSGGTVSNNGFRGNFMGYSIAAAGLKDWTIKDNWSTARHSGTRSPRCFDDIVNPDPMPFLYHQATVEGGEIQKDFVDGDFAYIVCIDGVNAQPVAEAAEEAPTAAPTAAPSSEPDTSTGSEALDGILGHVQQRMIKAIGILGAKVERAVGAARTGAGGKRDATQGTSPITEDVDARLAGIERAHTDFLKGLGRLGSKIKALRENLAETHVWQSDVLLHIQQEFYAQPKEPSGAKSERKAARAETAQLTATATSGHSQTAARVAYLVAGAGIAAAVLRVHSIVVARRGVSERKSA